MPWKDGTRWNGMEWNGPEQHGHDLNILVGRDRAVPLSLRSSKQPQAFVVGEVRDVRACVPQSPPRVSPVMFMCPTRNVPLMTRDA